MLLSICIATIEGREKFFESLYLHLMTQIHLVGLNGVVEIVFIKDNKEMPRGLKRQKMIEQSNGEYISHIDDDDWVDNFYVNTIVCALKEKPDCVGFNVLCSFPEGKFKAVVSNRYKTWDNNKDGYDYVRSPNHLAVIKREHCLKIGFNPDLDFGEDAEFSLRMAAAGLLQKEVFIDEYLYDYRYTPNK